MGRPKLLLAFGETTVLGSLVAALREGGVESVLLVLAPEDTSPADAALHRFAREQGLQVAVNPSPERGMLSSIQAGVAALPASFLEVPRNTLLITPADLPALAPTTVRAVVEAREAIGAPLAVPVLQEEKHRRRGHPLAMAAALATEIADLDPEIGLRQLLDLHAGELLEVPVEDRGAVRDVDRPEDLVRLGDRER